MKKRNFNKWKVFTIVVLSIYTVTMLWHYFKPIPENISYQSDTYRVNDDQVDFYYNVTGEKNGEKKFTDQIFKRTLEIIDEADEFIVLDYFLFNSYHEKKKEYPAITDKITKKLIEKKKANPDMKVIFISDEVNTSYLSHEVPQFEQMKKAGIEVVLTNTDPLRDSTPVYSGVWRMFFQWFGQSGNGWIPNALAETAPDMTLRSYLKIFNVKANHRKTITTEKTAMISSANPHDASAEFTNVAFEVKNVLVNDMLVSEKAAANTRREVEFPEKVKKPAERGDIKVRLLTENKIENALVKEINNSKKGDEIWVAIFYLADRDIVDALTDAANRGAKTNIIMDTNKHSFGQKKNGLPNIPMSEELKEDSDGKINIRWFAPTPEQFHAKMLYIKGEQESTIISGSANFTARNIGDFNLESDVQITAPNDKEIVQDVDQYFHTLWENKGAEYTADFDEHYEDTATLKRGVYTFQKLLNLTTY
ncbi:HKD family nuclease [Bacillus ectoiniformans]|nr:HKD family nuclease [Bacillus ectoiniformans]